MKATDRIFLNDDILASIEKTFHSRREGNFTPNALREDLILFFNEDNNGLPLALKAELSKQFPSESAVEHALKRDHSRHGANEPLRDLLCFYAFGTSWKNKIGEEKVNDEIAWSSQLKEELKENPENIIVSKLGKIESNVGEILTRLGSPSKVDDFGLSAAAERYNNASKHGRALEKEESAKEIILGLTKQITMRSNVRAYMHFELLKTLTTLGKYNQVIELKDDVMVSGEYISHTSFLIANAFSQLGDPAQALLHIERTLQKFPYDAYSLSVKAMSLLQLGNAPEALQVSSQALDYYYQGILTTGELHFDTKTYDVVPIEQPVKKEDIAMLFKAHILMLAGSGDNERAIIFSLSPECREDLYAQLFAEAHINPTDSRKILEMSEKILRKEYNLENMVAHLSLLIMYNEPEETIIQYYKELATMNKLVAKGLLLTHDTFSKYRSNESFTRLVE